MSVSRTVWTKIIIKSLSHVSRHVSEVTSHIFVTKTQWPISSTAQTIMTLNSLNYKFLWIHQDDSSAEVCGFLFCIIWVLNSKPVSRRDHVELHREVL